MVQVGSLAGDALWALLGLAGLTLLLAQDAVRVPLTLACAAYLAWLGWRSLGDAWRLPEADDAAAPAADRGALLTGAAIS